MTNQVFSKISAVFHLPYPTPFNILKCFRKLIYIISVDDYYLFQERSFSKLITWTATVNSKVNVCLQWTSFWDLLVVYAVINLVTQIIISPLLLF